MELETFHRFAEMLRSEITVLAVELSSLCRQGALEERRKEEHRRRKFQSTEKCLH
jgi:hypothetical protein